MTFRLTVSLACLVAILVALQPSDAAAQQKRQVDTCRDGKPDDQIKACTALIKRGGRDLEAHYFYRSRAWRAKRECDLALADAEKALSLMKDEANFAQLGVVLSDCKGDHARAAKIYSDGIKALPKSALMFHSRAVVLDHLSDPDALDDYNQALRLDPKRLDSLIARGLIWFGREHYDKAIADFTSAIGLKPDDARAYALRGRAYGDKGDRAQAFSDFERAITLDPSHAEYYSIRATYLSKADEYERALADYDQLIRLESGEAEHYLQRAIAYAEQEDWDKALADVKKVIDMKPDTVSAYSLRGFAFSKKGDTARAEADLDRAIRLDPKSDAGFAYRAAHYRDIGDYEKALADHARSIELLADATNYFARAKTLRLKGDLDLALADTNEAVKLETRPFWSLQQRGIVYRFRGEYDRAIADFDRILRDFPNTAAAYVERGRAYEKTGDLVRARADFERALKSRGSQFRTAHEDAQAQLAALGVAVPAVSSSPTAPIVKAGQGRRVALVIGNSDYAHVAKLTNPSRDAQAVAASLRAVGFETVMVGSDLSREQLIGRLREFARESEKADWAMVYYAGHGIEVGGVNYLIPVDAKLETDRDASFEAVSLENVLTAVESARKIKLVVLDACRDNPFAAQMRRTNATRSMSRGLSRVEPEGATLVVYAAKHGQTALDGDGVNSPFAAALTKRMATPDVEINKIFRLIRDDVMDATGGRQEPFTYGSLPGREDFYFVAR